MKTLKLLCLFAVATNFFIQTFFFEQRTTIKQLLSMAFLGLVFVLMLTAFALGLEPHRRDKLRAFVPFLICLIGIPLSYIGGIIWGSSIKESRFQRNLPRFNEVVDLIQKGELKPNPPDRFILLPTQYVDLTAMAFVFTNSDGTNMEFQTEYGFPVKHSGYLYVSSGEISNSHTLGNRSTYRINTNWFYFWN